MTRPELPLLLACMLSAAPAAAQTDPTFREPRGEMLYTTHCTACHNTQVHWRDGKLATDWESLRAQVRRWQNVSGLAWTDDEINAVTHHLNTIYYKFPPGQRVTRRTDPATKIRLLGRFAPWRDHIALLHASRVPRGVRLARSSLSAAGLRFNARMRFATPIANTRCQSSASP